MPAILPADIQAPLLEVEKLRVTFPTEQGFSTVVRDLDFRLEAGRTLGLVGESGSGKSVTALALMGLVPPPGHATHGRIRLGGVDLLGAPEKALQKIRGQRMAMIFQEPMTSLNPVMTVGEQIAEVFPAAPQTRQGQQPRSGHQRNESRRHRGRVPAMR